MFKMYAMLSNSTAPQRGDLSEIYKHRYKGERQTTCCLYIVYVSRCIPYVHACVPLVCQAPRRPEGGTGCTETEFTDVVSCHVGSRD